MSDGSAVRGEWVERFDQQATACAELGSALYGRLLGIIADDIGAGGPSWEVIAPHAELRFGQAGPLRLVGAAHRLAIAGAAPAWAAALPSCGGTVPTSDRDLAEAWRQLVDSHGSELRAGMEREVQTNEVARSAGLAFGAASTGFDRVRLVELGCSGGLNLRLDRFRIDLGTVMLGESGSPVRLAPEVRGEAGPDLRMPAVGERIGIDPHPVDPTSDEGRVTLLGFVWPDQSERFARIAAAIDLAAETPADLRRSADTAASLAEVLSRRTPTIVQQSIMWQYVPTDMRWQITSAIEAAGARADTDAPLAWVRYEPDEWDRRRASIWLRTWPDGADRLVGHADYHGRWVAPAHR